MADAFDAGMPADSAWIIRRATVRSERLPRFGEQLELRTWCSGVAKSVAERSTSVSGDQGAAVEVEAIWVYVDPELRRPTRLPQAFHDVYAESAAGKRPRISLRHAPEPPTGAEALDWYFALADVDLIGHVNNAMYWRVAEELLDLKPLAETPARLEAEYRGGIGPGPARIHRDGTTLWICDLKAVVAATISLEPG